MRYHSSSEPQRAGLGRTPTARCLFTLFMKPEPFDFFVYSIYISYIFGRNTVLNDPLRDVNDRLFVNKYFVFEQTRVLEC